MIIALSTVFKVLQIDFYQFSVGVKSGKRAGFELPQPHNLFRPLQHFFFFFPACVIVIVKLWSPIKNKTCRYLNCANKKFVIVAIKLVQ
jgi:hypothetical protein